MRPKFTKKAVKTDKKEKNIGGDAFFLFGLFRKSLLTFGAMPSLHHIARAVADVFLERRCPVCGRFLRLTEDRLCIFCAADLPQTWYWLLSRNPMADRFNALLAGHFAMSDPGTKPTPCVNSPFSRTAPPFSTLPCVISPFSRTAPSLTASSLRAEAPESPGLPTPAAPPHGRSLQTAGLSGTSATPASGSEQAGFATGPLQTAGLSGTSATPASGSDLRYVFAAALMFYRSEAGYAAIPKALKYHADYGMGRYYARMLGRRLAGSELFRDVSVVIPVPLHPLRRWRRGYNQAEVLAREVARALGASLRTDLLRRRRYTRTQTRLQGTAKARNVAAAFVLTRRARRMKAFDGTHALLLDDVFTTGATLSACFLALLPLFPPPASRISVATLAVVKE